jgi:hypothetical protein
MKAAETEFRDDEGVLGEGENRGDDIGDESVLKEGFENGALHFKLIRFCPTLQAHSA